MGYGVATYEGRIKRALNMKTDSVLWCAVGHTAVWPGEPDPPDEDPATTAIDTPIVYVKPSSVSLCKAVESGGDVTIEGQQYEFVADVDAYTEGARFLYLTTTFDPDIHPYANFRQFGVYSDLTPSVGHENDDWLAPANVDDDGVLEIYENHTVKSFGPGETRVIEIVIEFR